jgi:hypothetical protein
MDGVNFQSASVISPLGHSSLQFVSGTMPTAGVSSPVESLRLSNQFNDSGSQDSGSQNLDNQDLGSQCSGSQGLGNGDMDYPSVIEGADPTELLNYLHSGNLWMVNSRRRNGLVLIKSYHAEFAGPGAVVGSYFDLDCQRVIPVGKLSLIRPESHEERQKAYLIRRQWIRLTQQFTDQSVPLKRAQMMLTQFENYFDQQTIANIPDEAFSMLVGVLPYTVRQARRVPGKLNVKVKS